eukprot:Em0017g28a
MSSMSILNSLAQILSQGHSGKKVAYLSATCPDPQCHTTLVFPAHEASVECTNCGQRHSAKDLKDRRELTDREGGMSIEIAQARKMSGPEKKTSELVKVKGISNYQCKLLSPLLTEYGMDKSDQPKTLKELGFGDIFDCSKLSKWVFAIEENFLETVGYGRDRSKQEVLVPVHADGDGHCLVHAISRCVVGRELFWHALRVNLHRHLATMKDQYQEMFKEFYSEEEWPDIIAEADPAYEPTEGQAHGLRNIHIFGLANVLRRPIILLDSLSGMQSSGDYSGVFLPSLSPPEECSTQTPSAGGGGGGGLVPNSPIVVAWSSMGHNHFIPLVPIKDRLLPKLPATLRPKVWGQPELLLEKYVKLDETGAIELCGGKSMGDKYIHKLLTCMETLFYQKHNVAVSVVCDVHQYVFRSAGYVGIKPDVEAQAAYSAVQEGRLFRCLLCSAVCYITPEWLLPGGQLYLKATSRYSLEDGLVYNFPLDGITAKYDLAKDALMPTAMSCFWCSSPTRPLHGNGSIAYENGDRTSTQTSHSKCGCGYKHFWNNKEYDNLPLKVPLSLTWGGISKTVTAYWFQYESNPELNSNAYDVASQLVNENFPGQFGSERLVQQVVESVLHATSNLDEMSQVEGNHPAPPPGTSVPAPSKDGEKEDDSEPVSKFIAMGTGTRSRVLHKEELGVSEVEKRIKQRVEENARLAQSRKKGGVATAPRKESSGGPASPSQSSAGPVSHTLVGVDDAGAANHRVSATGLTSSATGLTSSAGGKSLKIKVTSYDGRTANLSLEHSTTYSKLQEAIHQELGILPSLQRLRAGFPPQELRPPADPNSPLSITTGEPPPSQASRSQSSAQHGKEGGKTFNSWMFLQNMPQLFAKGGQYYEQVVKLKGHKESLHVQFPDIPNKVFALNIHKEVLEVCLGEHHIPVGPLTPEEEALAMVASMTSSDESESEGGVTTRLGMGGVINKPQHTVKAFSGKGNTLVPDTRGKGNTGEQQLIQAAQMLLSTRLSMLHSREEELQDEVRALNGRLSRLDGDSDEASHLHLEQELLECTSELKEVRREIQELSTF